MSDSENLSKLYLQGVNDGYNFFFDRKDMTNININDGKTEEERAYLMGLIEGKTDAEEDLEDGIVDEFGEPTEE